nr:MAG TPA: major capsid protein [Bacteriophage sp.]
MATQLTTTSGISPSMQSYYDRKMLEHAKTQFVFANYAQKRSIPKNNGKTVQFRRWTLFTADPDTQALTEGTTPAAQNLSMSAITATVKQYGAYVEVSDLLDLTAVDNIIHDSSELLGEQLGNVLDMIVRDAMSATTNIQYADGKTSDNDITATQKLTVGEIRKAVRTLKKAKARKFTRKGGKPHYICIVDPDAVYDLQSDSLWQDVSKYSNAEQIYDGELGKMFGVVFIETTNAKIVENTATTKYGVHQTFVFGADSYGVVDVTGQGAIKAIIKPHGSSGTADPLDQRATVGAKVTAFTACVLNADWLVSIHHGVTA